MDASVLNPFLAELRAYKQTFDDKLEGLRDFGTLRDLQGPTRVALDRYIELYAERSRLVDVVIAACVIVVAADGDLRANGYPNAIPVHVSPEVAADLTTQHRSLEAAFAELETTSEAASGKLTLSAEHD